jgi:hypothetical protein
VPGKPFQPRLMFVGKVGAYPFEAHFRLKRLARDKHCSLLRKFVNYGRKKFYNIGS